MFASLARPPPPPPPAPPLPARHSLRLALIFDNKPGSNLSCGADRPARRVCALWDLNGDGGIAEGAGERGGRGEGGREGRKYEARSECRFTQPAGTMSVSERLFFFSRLCCRRQIAETKAQATTVLSLTRSPARPPASHRSVIVNVVDIFLSPKQSQTDPAVLLVFRYQHLSGC